MDQFHSDSYKKKSLLQEFFGSCLGRLVILLFVLLFLYIFALITIPSKKMMLEETVDNIHECLQENDSIKADEIDEIINNISRTINVADTTLTNPELFKAFLKYNRLAVYKHSGFQTVISTLSYEDLVLNTGAVRGDYNKKLTAPVMEEVPDSEYMGSTLNVEPYHFEGDENN